jgi:hypothetical protein
MTVDQLMLFTIGFAAGYYAIDLLAWLIWLWFRQR